MSLAPLILEESRCILADALTKISCNLRSANTFTTFTLELTSIEEKYTKLATTHRKYAPLILNFQIVGNNKPKQRYGGDSISAQWTRPGSVILLRRQCRDGINDSSTLACIVPNGGQQPASSSSPDSTISLMVFRRDHLDIEQNSLSEENTLFYATPVTTLISQVRQMEACLRMVKVSFLGKLLGQKNATHIRFDNSDDDEEEEVVCGVDVDDDAGGVLQEGYYVDNDDSGCSLEEDDGDDSNDCKTNLSGLLDNIPTLNNTQEKAAKLFLHSPPESLILVQG